MPFEEINRDDEHSIAQFVEKGMNALTTGIEVIDVHTEEKDEFIYATYTLRFRKEDAKTLFENMKPMLDKLGINPMKVSE